MFVDYTPFEPTRPTPNRTKKNYVTQNGQEALGVGSVWSWFGGMTDVLWRQDPFFLITFTAEMYLKL